MDIEQMIEQVLEHANRDNMRGTMEIRIGDDNISVRNHIEHVNPVGLARLVYALATSLRLDDEKALAGAFSLGEMFARKRVEIDLSKIKGGE